MNARNLVPFGLAALVGCNTEETVSEPSEVSSQKEVVVTDTPQMETQTSQEETLTYTPIQCSDSVAPDRGTFSHDLYDALKPGTYISMTKSENGSDSFVFGPYYDKTADYDSVVSLVVDTLPDVKDERVQDIFCEAKSLALASKPKETFEKDVVEAAYTRAAEYTDSSYPHLADKYVSLAARITKKDSSVVCQSESK